MSFDLAARLAARQADNLYRQRPLLQSPQGPVVQVEGKEYWLVSSNDYLRLSQSPRRWWKRCSKALHVGASVVVLRI